MDPLYVLKLKCCYLEELLEEKYDGQQADLLKEIADLKSRLKTKGINTLKLELQEYLPTTDDDNQYIESLKTLLSNKSTPEHNEPEAQRLKDLDIELNESRVYIKELESIKAQFKDENYQFDSLQQEKKELESKYLELLQNFEDLQINQNDPPSPLLNKGNDTSILMDTSLIKSQEIQQTTFLDSKLNEILLMILDSLEEMKSQQGQFILDSLDLEISNLDKESEEFLVLTDIAKILREFNSKLLSELSGNESNHIDNTGEASDLRFEIQHLKQSLDELQNENKKLREEINSASTNLDYKSSDEYKNLQEKVKNWKIQVMQAMNEKEKVNSTLQENLDLLRNELSECSSKLDYEQNLVQKYKEEVELLLTQRKPLDENLEENENFLRWKKDYAHLNEENVKLKSYNEQINSRLTEVIDNAESLKKNMDMYEQEIRDLLDKLEVVKEEKENLNEILRALSLKLQARLTEEVDDKNILEKYELMINATESFINELEVDNVQLHDRVRQLEQHIDIEIGKTEAEKLRAEKLEDLLHQKEKIVQVDVAYLAKPRERSRAYPTKAGPVKSNQTIGRTAKYFWFRLTTEI
eukprot:NODE_7_length_67686_cov_1.621421.p8 type:complete len:584 gc:universal NODE_7_length_67686_cov_1.621421:10118-11869(+)